MKLYHYTCRDRAPMIRRDRWLKPIDQTVLGGADLVWLTDLDMPDRYGLGLTSELLKCDRTEVRVTVVAQDAVHWPKFARTVGRAARWALESAPGALPMHWYVATMPVPVLAVTP